MIISGLFDYKQKQGAFFCKENINEGFACRNEVVNSIMHFSLFLMKKVVTIHDNTSLFEPC